MSLPLPVQLDLFAPTVEHRPYVWEVAGPRRGSDCHRNGSWTITRTTDGEVVATSTDEEPRFEPTESATPAEALAMREFVGTSAGSLCLWLERHGDR